MLYFQYFHCILYFSDYRHYHITYHMIIVIYLFITQKKRKIKSTKRKESSNKI